MTPVWGVRQAKVASVKTTKRTMLKDDSWITKQAVKTLKNCEGKKTRYTRDVMSSIEGRTALLGTAVFLMNYGAFLISEDQIRTGAALFLIGVFVIYTRELLFDVEYNGHGTIVDAMMHRKSEDDKEETQ